MTTQQSNAFGMRPIGPRTLASILLVAGTLTGCDRALTAPRTVSAPSTSIPWSPPAPTVTVVWPSPTPWPTPAVDWRVPVLSLNGVTDGYPVTWVNATQLLLNQTYTEQGEFAQKVATFQNDPLDVSIRTSPSFSILRSPQSTFVYDCHDVTLTVQRTLTHELVAHATVPFHRSTPGVSCSVWADWAPDESTLALVAEDQSLLVWPLTGGDPTAVGVTLAPYSTIAWSPDSQHMAVVLREPDTQWADVGILTRSGQLERTLTVHQGSDGTWLDWLTPSILISTSRYTRWFYDLADGQLLFDWNSMPNGDGVFHQLPLVSPDQRWVFLDQTAADPTSQGPTRGMKAYSLYDLVARHEVPLVFNPDLGLRFSGWSADGQVLYVVARRLWPTSPPIDGWPYGLLAIEPATGHSTLLYPNAVTVIWNADQSWAYVTTMAPDVNGDPGRLGEFWQPTTDLHRDTRRLSDTMLYGDPASDGRDPQWAISTAWSPDGSRLALSDGQGRLWLSSPQGETLSLATTLPTGVLRLLWSPDGHWLSVERDAYLWIVPVGAR